MFKSNLHNVYNLSVQLFFCTFAKPSQFIELLYIYSI